ncbi:dephospho-CoA kinase [soil metagenome]
MLCVGLTGNIAAGKSAVADVWRDLGATVIDADVLARRAVEPGSPALAEIAARWGKNVVSGTDGTLDREALGRIVFGDPDARARLEGIVHPEVRRLREIEHAAAAERGDRIVVDDVPLLFEVGMEDAFDVVVLVDAPAETRLRRLTEERGMDRYEARRRIAAQMPAEEKRARADIVIDNTRTLAELWERAAKVWEGLERRSEQDNG